MKIKEGFELRKIAGNYVVFPVGEKTVDFNGMLSLSETGAFLWERILKGEGKEALLKGICSEYKVEEKTALEDIESFIEKLKEIGCLEY